MIKKFFIISLLFLLQTSVQASYTPLSDEPINSPEEFYKEYEVAEGDTVKAPSIPELKEGESFLGWSLDDSNDPDSVIDVSDIEITKDTDFYSVLIINRNDPKLM